MLNGFQIFDADAHALMTPGMWADLPDQYKLRRPRPIRVADSTDMGRWNTGWLIEGGMHPHPFGPGAEAANTPSMVLPEFGASPQERAAVVGFPVPVGSSDFSDPEARLQDLERMGIDIQVLFPTTLYARMTGDPGFEAALYRSYNRYMAQRCKFNPKRLKWAGLLPLREIRRSKRSMRCSLWAPRRLSFSGRRATGCSPTRCLLPCGMNLPSENYRCVYTWE